GESASLVIGQSGFTTKTAPNPPTAASEWAPEGITFDSSGNLWVADAANQRVLEYATPFTSGESASLVIGQSGFTTNTAPNPPTAASEYLPQGITFDSSGNLWIADGGSNRILEYIKGSGFTNEESASLVIGQSGFATNATAISQSGLNIQSIAFNGPTFDSSGNLWMADELNNRVLEYVSISLAIGGHNVSIYHPPSLGNDYYYKYGSGFTLNGKSFD
ncbi:MAG: hypothetical protein KGI11_10170, partial [Thaumarchaeota archaeon]|nr:hypothetical protein [Nitrososphaerota archaeon]